MLMINHHLTLIIIRITEEPTDDINGSVGTTEKMFDIKFIKAKTKFCLSLHYNGDNSYLFAH